MVIVIVCFPWITQHSYPNITIHHLDNFVLGDLLATGSCAVLVKSFLEGNASLECGCINTNDCNRLVFNHNCNNVRLSKWPTGKQWNLLMIMKTHLTSITPLLFFPIRISVAVILLWEWTIVYKMYYTDSSYINNKFSFN